MRPDSAPATLAAITLINSASAEPLLDSIVGSLKRHAVAVGGYLQREYPAPAGHDAEVVVEDIETGEAFAIMQPRGGVGSGCRLNPGVLADVTGRALARLDGDIDILVLNRFGRSETEGSGLRSVYEKAIERGLPVLTSVKPEHVEAWQAYTGEMSVLLPFDETAVLDWCRAVLRLQAGA